MIPTPYVPALEALYLSHKSKLQDVRSRCETASGDLEGPYLVSPNTAYAAVNQKVVFVGQQTNGWVTTDCDVSEQMKSYAAFNLGAAYYSSPFWNVIRKIEERLTGEQYCSVALNLNRWDQGGGTPSPHNLLILAELDFLLLEELRLLSPDVVIFLAGPSYEARVGTLLGGERINILGPAGRQLCEIRSPVVNSRVFSTYHPNYLRKSGLEDKVLDAIVTSIRLPQPQGEGASKRPDPGNTTRRLFDDQEFRYSMKGWIDALFAKTGKPVEHREAFEKLFWHKLKRIEAEFGDGRTFDLQAPLDEGDPESGTVYEFIEDFVGRDFEAYFVARDDRHRFSDEFALDVAMQMGAACGDLEEAISEAFARLMTSQVCDLTNPAYAEAFNACIRQGKSEDFAAHCAENVVSDFKARWTPCYEGAVERDRLIQSQLKKGRSLEVAKVYALKVALGTNEEYADVYAAQYARQLERGKTPAYAEEFARVYLEAFERSGSWDDEDPDNFRIEVMTEGHMLAKSKGFDPVYSSLFEDAYFREDAPSHETEEEALSRAEAEADAEMERRRQGLPPKP
jgi:hypothetical protein